MGGERTGESNTGEAETGESGKTICQNNNVPHDSSSCLHPQRKRKQVP